MTRPSPPDIQATDSHTINELKGHEKKKKGDIKRHFEEKHLVDKSDRYPGMFISLTLGRVWFQFLLCPHPCSPQFRLKQRRDGKIKQIDLCGTTEKKQKRNSRIFGVGGEGGDCVCLPSWLGGRRREAAFTGVRGGVPVSPIRP